MSPGVRSISVLMPILNGARHLDRVLDALAGQHLGIPWDFTALDCGSTDGTLEIFARHAATWPVPLRVRGIQREEFNHGCARNLLAALSTGELLVFVTDDAIAMSADWLATLAANFEDQRVGAAYCRNVTRPGADPLVRIFNELDPAYGRARQEVALPPPAEYARMGPDERRVLFNFCDTASAMRRALWERHPYPRCVFGEDVLMARAFLEGGYTVVFDERAAVEHSHDYDAAETAKRALLDARFNAEWLARVCVPTRKTARRLALEQVTRDRAALSASGLSGEELERRCETARALRCAHFEGLHAGGRARERFRRTRLLDSPAGSSWLVVDGEGSSLAWRRWAEAMAAELGGLGRNAHVVAVEELAELPAAGALHFVAPGPRSLGLLTRAVVARRAFVAHLDPGAMQHADVLEASRRAELALVPTRAARQRFVSEASFDPLQLSLSPCAGLVDDAQQARPRDARENALELLFRHRLLEARADELPPGVRLDLPAAGAARRGGDVREPGGGDVLLGPDGWLEFDLDLPPGRHELDLHQACAAAPAGASFDGRVLLDGRNLARLGPRASAGKRAVSVLTLPLTGTAHTLRIVGGPLRLARVVLHRGPERALRPSERLRAVERRLRALVGLPSRWGA